ncbi:hypothetical protein TRFO_09095 [Tritrichomonas foetus]|uniref:Myb-like DNA-binding domain containing protein n=1 Tax=Tritrichomonas foetus TaxID=1144522 RepID=A0A1J4JFN8_9EUKA|nr:hypothetical protein TRFO_09095 [Tritrichomonas foetus]|eukprot:OHS97962.1 hypothetical protein TRFO_09095 [Tritrichomonas foetus]
MNKNYRRRIPLFSDDEDSKFVEYMANNPDATWREVASIFSNHTARQCRDHWLTQLSPVIKTTEQWTPHEEDLLINKVIELGENWDLLSQFFPNRSTNELKNQWNTKNHRKLRSIHFMDYDESSIPQDYDSTIYYTHNNLHYHNVPNNNDVKLVSKYPLSSNDAVIEVKKEELPLEFGKMMDQNVLPLMPFFQFSMDNPQITSMFDFNFDFDFF